MGFPRQEYWSELPFPPPGDLHNPRIEPASPASPTLQAVSLLLSHQGRPEKCICSSKTLFHFYFLNYYLFIWLCQVLVEACRIFLVAAWVTSSCGMWTLNCSMWIQFPNKRSNHGSLHRECRVLATGPPEKPLIFIRKANNSSSPPPF